MDAWQREVATPLTVAVRACLFALVALVGAATKGGTDCTVTSVWPDGTELQRCAAAKPLQSRPQQAPSCQLHPTEARACLLRECFIEGEGGSKKRAARPIPSRPCDASHTAQHRRRRCRRVRPCATRHTTHARAAGGAAKGVSKEFKWLKDTRWHWNNWRDVIFRADGSFLAPAEGCEREGNPECRWSSDDEKVHARPGP